MTWLKLADTFTDHPKVVAAGDQAAWLYIAGLCYCSRHLTDGQIPADAVRRLTGLPSPQKYARKLVEVGLWDETHSGYAVHDYTAHQRSRNDVEEQRERTRVRVQKHRSNAVTNGDVTLLEESREEKSTKEHGQAKLEPFAVDFAEWWGKYPRKVHRADAYKAYQARRRQGIVHGRLMLALETYRFAKTGDDPQFVLHGATFLAKDGPWSEWELGPPEVVYRSEPAPYTFAPALGDNGERKVCKRCANTGRYFEADELVECDHKVTA